MQIGQLARAQPLDLGDGVGLGELPALLADVLRPVGVAGRALVEELHRVLVAFALDVDDQLGEEEAQHAQHDEHPQWRGVARALAGEVVDGDAAGHEQVAQGAEDATVQVPERFEHLLQRVTDVAHGVDHRLAAGVAVVPLQRHAAVLAMAWDGVIGRCAHVLQLSGCGKQRQRSGYRTWGAGRCGGPALRGSCG